MKTTTTLGLLSTVFVSGRYETALKRGDEWHVLRSHATEAGSVAFHKATVAGDWSATASVMADMAAQRAGG